MLGIVTLRDPAGAGGATILISGPKTPAVQFPATAFVSAGSATGTFAVVTTDVSAPTPVSVCGSFGGASSCAVVTVMPPSVLPTTSAVGAARARVPRRPR